MQLNDGISYTNLLALVQTLNDTLKQAKLVDLMKDEFSQLSEDEIAERLDGESPEDYFHDELTEVDGYELEDIGDHSEFLTGKTFAAINEPRSGDPIASFVLTGYAGEGIYNCCYIADVPNNPLNKEAS